MSEESQYKPDDGSKAEYDRSSKEDKKSSKQDGGGSGDGDQKSKKDDGSDGEKSKEDKSGKGESSKKDGESSEDEDESSDEGSSEEDEKRLPRWPFVLAAVVVVAFVGGVLWVIFRPRPDVWTDDAYVRVHYTMVAPRVSGHIAAVPVDDNYLVKTGDLLAQLDPRDYETAVAAAEAQVERDEAQSGDIGATIERQPALIEQAAAEVDAARARLAFAEADARRYENLATTGAGTGQQRQQSDTTLKASRASLRSAQAQLEANRRQLEVLKKQKSASDAAVKADRARLEQAKLNLSYTRILAPIDGMVGQRSVQVGNVVSPGATLMVVVPLQEVYVTANYREVDLIHMRTGQPVTIHVDAYDISLRGRVNAIPAASGASFAPIAPNNATGNFTKIVQRLPVRIDIEPGQPLAKLLRVGFSVETTVHTDLEDVVGEQALDPGAVTGR